MPNIGAVHGEPITVLTGADAGKTFFANIVEQVQEFQLSTDLGEDPRAKTVMRFDERLPMPALVGQERIRTSNGKIWIAVRNPQGAYLSNDFELREVVTGLDT